MDTTKLQQNMIAGICTERDRSGEKRKNAKG